MTREARAQIESLLSDIRAHMDLPRRRFGADGDDSEYAFCALVAERLQRALALMDPDTAAPATDDDQTRVIAELRRAKSEESPFCLLGHYLEHGPLGELLRMKP